MIERGERRACRAPPRRQPQRGIPLGSGAGCPRSGRLVFQPLNEAFKRTGFVANPVGL
jgi:hypothetical protein